MLNQDMTNKSLSLLRILIVAQFVVTIWFVLSPDLLPEPIKQAERFNDQGSYAILDSLIVPLTYLQALLCLLIWKPTRIASYSYLVVTALIAGLGAFSGPAILSAIDALLGYLQVLASGGMLGVLWLSGYLSMQKAKIE